MEKEITDGKNKTWHGGVEENSGPRQESNPDSPVAHFPKLVYSFQRLKLLKFTERGSRTIQLEPEVYSHMCYLFLTEGTITFILAWIEFYIFKTVVSACLFDA
jgi:hypothetical protein